MKKHLLIILPCILTLITFTQAKDNDYIKHIWNDYIVNYDWKSIVMYDTNINTKTQKCPVWYHIWTADDWSNLIELRYNVKWQNYKYMSLSNKTYNQIEEEWFKWETNLDDIWFHKIWSDFWFSDSFASFRTSTNWPKNQPYVLYSKWLEKRYVGDFVYHKNTRYSFIWIKTCWSVNIADFCNKTVLARCFKNDENTVIDNWFSKEYNDAYVFAYNNKITTMPSIEEANMNWEIIRAEIAKMLANWVKSIGYYANSNTPCNFTDTTSVKWDLATAIIESCQYCIMWQWISQFRPYDKITKAEVATAVSRILWWNQYDWWTPFYINHVYALENAWVLSNSSNINSNELRWNVMTILMRANDILKNNSTDCDSPEIALTCATDTEKCPDKCK